MNAGDKYFTASVKILRAKLDLERALEALDQDMPLMENIALKRLTNK